MFPPATIGKVTRLSAWMLLVQCAVLLGTMSMLQAESTLNGNVDPDVAFEMSRNGSIELIDIRRPSEWRQSGVGLGAHRISIHESGFVERLESLLGGDRTKPLALICAAGSRSSMTKAKLNALGFTNVSNIPEGMFGSSSGPGWIERNLPLEN